MEQFNCVVSKINLTAITINCIVAALSLINSLHENVLVLQTTSAFL